MLGMLAILSSMAAILGPFLLVALAALVLVRWAWRWPRARVTVRRPLEEELLLRRAVEAEGKLDIAARVAAGEDDALLALDYGGTGWERCVEVQAVYALRRRLADALQVCHQDGQDGAP